MIIDFSHYKIQNYVSSEQEKEQLAKFFACVERADGELVLRVQTTHGSHLEQMKLLQLIGDTLYLTDEYESMAVIDLALVHSIEVL